MSVPSYQNLFEHLESSGHLSAEERDTAEQAVAASTEADDSASRLISIVAGIGAWLATLFLIGALFAFGLIKPGWLPSLALAGFLGAVAVGIDRFEFGRNVFTSQLVLATSFAAQAVALAAMDRLDQPVRMLGAAASCGTMYALIPSRANRLFSGAFLGGYFVVEALDNEVGFALLFGAALAAPCTVFGARRALSSRVRLALRPAAYVGALLATGLSFEFLINAVADWMPQAQRIMLAVAAAAMLALAHTETEPEAEERRFIWAAIAVVLLGLVTTPGIFCAALLVGVGLWRHRIWLAGLGAIALSVHLSTYYYQLDLTLLAKSGVLLASGLVLLGLRWLLDADAEKSAEKTGDTEAR